MHRLPEGNYGFPQERTAVKTIRRHQEVRRRSFIGGRGVPKEKIDKAGGGAVDRLQESQLALKIPVLARPHL